MYSKSYLCTCFFVRVYFFAGVLYHVYLISFHLWFHLCLLYCWLYYLNQCRRNVSVQWYKVQAADTDVVTNGWATKCYFSLLYCWKILNRKHLQFVHHDVTTPIENVVLNVVLHFCPRRKLTYTFFYTTVFYLLKDYGCTKSPDSL